MADEELSDAELVAQLQQYGETIQLPLKNSKRQILLKKLNHFKAKSNVRNDRRSYSAVSAESSNRSPRSSPGGLHDISSSPTTRSLTASSPQTTKTRSFSNVSDRYGGPSSVHDHVSDDSDVDHGGSSFHFSTSIYNSFDNNVGNHTGTREKKRYSHLSDSVLRTLRRRTVEPLQPPGHSHRSAVMKLDTDKNRSNIANESSDDEIPVPSPARSRLYPELNKISSFLSKSDDNKFESSDSDIDDNFSSHSRNQNTSYLHSSINNVNHSGAKEAGALGYLSSLRSSYLNSSSTLNPRSNSLRRGYQNGQHRVQQYRSRYLEALPQILVALAALFFLGLFTTYIVKHNDYFFSWFFSSNTSGAGNHLLHCVNKDPISENCFNKDEVDKTLKIVEKLFEDLSLMKGKALCDNSKLSDSMSITQFKDQIIQEFGDAEVADRLFQCSLMHIIANPHWNIGAETEEGKIALYWTDVSRLKSEVAFMSFMCRLRRSFSTVLYGIFMVVLVIVVGILLYLYIKYRLKQKESEQKEVYAMVEKIIDILQNHYEQTKSEDSGEAHYLAVQHVRDQLLSPSKRHKLQPIWDKAVKFIAANESRIRLQVQLIHGDEFEVWRWLQPTAHNGKIWQGQAFGENRENKGTNQVIYSPTPCLKIRNMFDSNVENEDNWEDSVTDAILEKCRNIDCIVHIFVDVESREGCVYLKCSSCEAAGRARFSLHGWWFDGRLVTVKHLKTDYYHKRWPESRDATTPLKPSTNQMRSLSQPYYRSSLEMT